MKKPGDIAAILERETTLPEGNDERFSGCGIMGLPFRSGHFLALRRFPNASIGPGYTSLGHLSGLQVDVTGNL